MNQGTFNIIILATPIVIGGLIAAINANGINDTTEKVVAWTRKQGVGSGWLAYIINPILWIIVKFCDWTDGFAHHGLKNGIRIAATLYFIAAWLFILYVAFMIAVGIAISILMIWLFWFKLVPMAFEAMNGSSGSYKQDNPSHKQDNSVHEQENSGATNKDMRSGRSVKNGNLFETRNERLEMLHNNGEQDAANSESTLLGETNRHVPFFGISESEREDNEAYKKGFENGRKNRR